MIIILIKNIKILIYKIMFLIAKIRILRKVNKAFNKYYKIKKI